MESPGGKGGGYAESPVAHAMGLQCFVGPDLGRHTRPPSGCLCGTPARLSVCPSVHLSRLLSFATSAAPEPSSGTPGGCAH